MSERILIFEPHPDDVAFQISGSVVKWLGEGNEVMICTVTNGNNSTFDISVKSEAIEKIMSEEHSRAMELLGLEAGHSIRWRYNDLGLDPGRDRLPLLKDMIRLIRKFKPATVVTMDPKNCDNEENPDHKLVAVTGLEAAAMAAYPNVFREQFDEPDIHQHLLFASSLRSKTRCTSPHFVGRMLYYMSPEPDLFIDISGRSLERKIELGFIYASQLELMMHEAKERLKTLGTDFALFDLPKEQLWPMMCAEIAADTASEFNKKHPDRPAIQHAEAFRLQYLGIVDKIRAFLPEK
jgi:LmbE family N-acetylglucosaminyl deacetylase